jgi:hypothetical protein
MLLAHIVRSALLCFSSLVPPNGAIAEVAFTTSMQIVVSLVYVLAYATVVVLQRILCSRTAALDPSDNLHDELTQESLHEHLHHSRFQGNASRRGHVRAWEQLREARHRWRQKVRRVTAQLLLNRPATDKSAQSVATDVRLEGSLPDVFSDDSAEENAGNVYGAKGAKNARQSVIGTMHGRAVYGLDEEESDAGVFPDPREGIASSEATPSTIPMAQSVAASSIANIPHVNRKPVYSASPYEPDDLPEDVLHTLEPANVYSEVYALGFAVFVISYSVDCTNMQTGCTLILGIAVLAMRDIVRVLDPSMDETIASHTQFSRAICVVAFMLMVAAQICAFVGIARVPSYHAASREGFAIHIPAPATVLDTLLAIVFPLLAPLLLHPICKKENVHRLQPMLRAALPTTAFVAVWFLSLFGTMDAEMRETLGVDTVNAAVNNVLAGDHIEVPVVLLAPLLKVPAVLAVVSCCVAGKAIDILTALGLVFYVKQKGLVKEPAMQDMLVISTIFASFAWVLTTVRYFTPLMRCVARTFAASET